MIGTPLPHQSSPLPLACSAPLGAACLCLERNREGDSSPISRKMKGGGSELIFFFFVRSERAEVVESDHTRPAETRHTLADNASDDERFLRCAGLCGSNDAKMLQLQVSIRMRHCCSPSLFDLARSACLHQTTTLFCLLAQNEKKPVVLSS